MTDQRFEGRKAAVTGAGGFIGSAICRRWPPAGRGRAGSTSTRPPPAGSRAAGASFVEADVADRAALEAAFDETSSSSSTPPPRSRVGLHGRLRRVNVAAPRTSSTRPPSAGAERVVHISSVVVYGYEDRVEQDEAAFRRAHGIPYIDTKSASDRLACRRGAVVVRPGDVYGPGSVPWTLRPLEMARAGQLAVPGRGDGLMLPLYVDDLAEAVVARRWPAASPARPTRSGTTRRRVTFEEYFNRLARIVGGTARRGGCRARCSS